MEPRCRISPALPRPALAAVVEAILSRPDADLDYAEAKLAFDALVDPSEDTEGARSHIERLVCDVRELAASGADYDLMAALRKRLYEPGLWNDHHPFLYDHGDPSGQNPANARLARYLQTRRGNCVSMPALVLILGDRLSLDMALACAPLHWFVRWRRGDGRVMSLETTSAMNPCRDAWFRGNLPMSDRAIQSGLYMRALSRREAIASLATVVVEHLVDMRRWKEARAVAVAILRQAPRDGHMLAKLGTSYAGQLQDEFERRYAAPFLIPRLDRPRHASLIRGEQAAFAAAEALGWEEVELSPGVGVTF